MEHPEHQIQVLTSEWPSGLKTIEEAARELNIDAERLRALADGGFAPHYRIDSGAPLFRMSELKRWAGANLVERIAGRDLPAPIRIVVPAPKVQDFRRVPIALREIAGLCDITDETLRTGIYFLCRDGALLYVGQSINVAYRVAEHSRRYEPKSGSSSLSPRSYEVVFQSLGASNRVHAAAIRLGGARS
jgi:hypothetical protein